MEGNEDDEEERSGVGEGKEVERRDDGGMVDSEGSKGGTVGSGAGKAAPPSSCRARASWRSHKRLEVGDRRRECGGRHLDNAPKSLDRTPNSGVPRG